MPRFNSRVGGFSSRIPHWVCSECGIVSTYTKPSAICSHCKASVKYLYFPSKKEFARYKELKLMELAGLIDGGSLELQPCYEITVTQKVYLDFRYTVHGKTVVEDAKTSGTNTNDSKRKRKELLVQHGVKVVLV